MEQQYHLTLEPVKRKSTKTKNYDQLPIYKASVDLLKQLWNSTQKAPVIARTGLIKDTEKEIIQVIYNIQKAATCADKKDILNETLLLAKHIQIELRLYFDLGFLSKKGFAVVSSKSEDVVRQLTGWFKSFNS